MLHTVTGEAPWVVRVAEIKASAAINLDAERKVTQLNEELQSLVRAIRARVRYQDTRFCTKR
jgi:dynactin 1